MHLQLLRRGFVLKIKPALPRLIVILGGLLVLAGMIGLVGTQFLIKNENFDLRRAASGSNSPVIILSKISPSQVVVGQEVMIVATINTKSVQTNGVQLVLNLPGTSQIDQVKAKIAESTGLQSAYIKVEPAGNSTKVAIIALPAQIGQAFTNNTNTKFMELTFVPKKSGTITISTNQERSIVTAYKVDPPQNILQPAALLKINVAGASSTPTPKPTTKPAATPTQSDCSLKAPTHFEAEFTGENKIKLSWSDANTSETGFEIFLIAEGSPPNGGRMISTVKKGIPPDADHYVWQISSNQQNRQYYRFLLKVIGADDCQAQIRSQSIYPQNPSGDSLTLGFSLQGLKKSGVHVDGLVTLKNLSQPSADPISFFGSFQSDDQGILTSTRPIYLGNLRIDPAAQYQISVKTHASLNKILGQMPLKGGRNSAPTSWHTTQLMVGDYVQNGNSFNAIDIGDIGLMLSQFTGLSTKAEDELAQFDVNYDGKLELQDLSIVLSNYTQLIVRGDSP